MAVGVVLEFEGATLDQYDEILDKMGLTSGGPGGPGGISHWVTATDSGIRVTDLWESQEAFDSFAETQIGPISAEVGITTPPVVTIHEVHAHLTQA